MTDSERRDTDANDRGPGGPFARRVVCAWCGNRYRSVVPADLDRGRQGSHCASDVVSQDGAWIVRGGYGSDEHDMHRHAFVAHPPNAPADPVCDECISERQSAGDLKDDPPECYRPDDFSPRPPGTHRLVEQIRRMIEDRTAMRALVDVAIEACDSTHTEEFRGRLRDAVRSYRKHQRYTGELWDGGEAYEGGETEVAEQMRESARQLERIATFWESRGPAKKRDD